MATWTLRNLDHCVTLVYDHFHEVAEGTSMNERIAFRMVLNEGMAEEYRRRHDEIWPALSETLRNAGVSDYTIWLDPGTHHLFATLLRSPDNTLDTLPDTEIVQRWWAFMADIMVTEADSVAPVQIPLELMFAMP
jgi:L-rhamnose mutarotase